MIRWAWLKLKDNGILYPHTESDCSEECWNKGNKANADYRVILLRVQWRVNVDTEQYNFWPKSTFKMKNCWLRVMLVPLSGGGGIRKDGSSMLSNFSMYQIVLWIHKTLYNKCNFDMVFFRNLLRMWKTDCGWWHLEGGLLSLHDFCSCMYT